MNRNLFDYQEQYLNQPYEKYQVFFRKKKLIEILNNYNHQKILEIGCGMESIFLDFTSYKHLTVIEPTQVFYNKAINDIEKVKNKNVSVINELFENSLPFLKQIKFDFVLVSSLLHEIPDLPIFFKTLLEIATEDTIIHINVPNAGSFHRLLAVEMGLIKSEFQKSNSNIQFQQHNIFNINLLKEMVQDNGFTVIESGSYSFKPFTHQQMQDMINSSLLTEQMLDGFYKMEKYLPDLGSEIFVNIIKTKK